MARVLVVDDDELTRRVVRRMLEREDHEVSEAEDGDVALRCYRQSPVDLVILDIYMPEKEGLETILELRTEFPDVKIIAISGGGGAFHLEPLRTAKHFGAIRTLVKPIDREELISAVRDVLRGQE